MDIFRYLREIARNQSTLTLLNVYKGVPISHDAQIRSIGDSEIQVHSNKFQLACLYYQQETFLKGQELPYILRSQVESLHLGRDDATLTNLEVTSENIGNRSQVRVVPSEPLNAIIQFSGAPVGLAAPIADISAEGAAAYLEPYIYSPRLCRPGNQVSVAITLPDTVSQKIKRPVERNSRDTRNSGSGPSDATFRPGGTVVLSTIGEVTSVHSELIGYRVGMRLYFKDLSRMVIMQYISQRQAEIIRDLTQLADELYSRRK
jgi:hypothetical protein